MVVNGVVAGAISLQEACCRYELSLEEFLAWQRAIETNGVAGLRATRFQLYRNAAAAGLAPPSTAADQIGSVDRGPNAESAHPAAGLENPIAGT
jgi:hypothetical protein